MQFSIYLYIVILPGIRNYSTGSLLLERTYFSVCVFGGEGREGGWEGGGGVHILPPPPPFQSANPERRKIFESRDAGK